WRGAESRVTAASSRPRPPRAPRFPRPRVRLASSAKRVPERDGFREERVSFVQRPLELRADDLLEHAIEIGRYLRREERARALGEASARLEKIGHVERAARAIPVQIADGVIADGVEQPAAPLALALEERGGGGSMEHLRLVRDVADERTELGIRRVLERVVTEPGVDPRAGLIGRDIERLGPFREERRDAPDVAFALLAHLRPRREFQ